MYAIRSYYGKEERYGRSADDDPEEREMEKQDDEQPVLKKGVELRGQRLQISPGCHLVPCSVRSLFPDDTGQIP